MKSGQYGASLEPGYQDARDGLDVWTEQHPIDEWGFGCGSRADGRRKASPLPARGT